MSTIIIFKDKTEIEIDATLRRKHSRSAQITKHKVSKGSDITDHVISDNKKFSLEGIISETTQINGVALMESAFDKFEEAIEKGELLKVNCRRKDYENLILTGFDCTDSAEKGASLVFSLDFEEVRFATTKTEKRNESQFPTKKNNGKAAKDKPNSKQQSNINQKVTQPIGSKVNSISKAMFSR